MKFANVITTKGAPEDAPFNIVRIIYSSSFFLHFVIAKMPNIAIAAATNDIYLYIGEKPVCGHTPIFLPGEFQGQRSLADYSLKRVGHN